MQEFNTQAKIISYLSEQLSIPKQQIKKCANTGLMVDIYGKSAPNGQKLLIGARADIDALTMAEDNNLPFKSITNASHMCGHDGHTACLLGGLSLYLENLEKIPSNKGVRFIFQPGEEGYRGAYHMMQEGAMTDVDEIFGFHNMPNSDLIGKISLRNGYMLRAMTTLDIRVIGKGGHGSQPENC